MGYSAAEDQQVIGVLRDNYISVSRGTLGLCGILLALLPLKLLYLPGSGPYGVDASYFYQIARNVAEGEGLKTNVSIYHEGMQQLPGPTRVYPLWPVTLGLLGSVVGIQPATQFLPFFLYFVDLILLYYLVGAITDHLGFARRDRFFGPAHWVVLVFGSNRLFFTATAHPYTEGIAFALAFGALLALNHYDQTGHRTSMAVTGALAGLSLLARSQMAILGFAIGSVVLWEGVRKKNWLTPLLYVFTFIAVLLPWYVYLAIHFPLAALNPFAGMNPFFLYRETPAIKPFEAWVVTDGLIGWLRDRLPGIVVALDPRNPMSYFSSFGAVVALIPIAVIRAATRWTAIRSSAARTFPALVISGVLFQATLLHFHATFFLPWLFGWRHGLPLILLLAPTIVLLLHDENRILRICSVLIVAASVGAGLTQIVTLIESPRPTPSEADIEFVRWLDARPEPPTILSPAATTIGMLSHGGFHWTLCSEPAEQTELMIEHLPIDFVLVYESELGCPFIHPLLGQMRPVARFGDENALLLLQPNGGDR